MAQKKSGFRLGDALSEQLREKFNLPHSENSPSETQSADSFEVDGVPTFYVADTESFQKALQTLERKKRIAIDLEFDDYSFRYGRRICLIQVYDEETIYLIDPQEIEDITPFFKILENPAIEKLFHSCNSDILMFQECYKVQLRNIGDTSLMHKFVKEEFQDIGLVRLLEQELEITVPKGEQRSDWTIRPLRHAQLEYAAKDVRYLPELANLLNNQLLEKEALEGYNYERKKFEALTPKRHAEPWANMLRKHRPDPVAQELAIFFYKIRDSLARELDKPPYIVWGDHKLVELAKKPPQNEAQWSKLRGCHPKLRHGRWLQKLKKVTEEVLAEQQKIRAIYRVRKRVLQDIALCQQPIFQQQVEERQALLELLRDEAKNRHGAEFQRLLFSNRLMRELLTEDARERFSLWQFSRLETLCKEANIDVMQLCFPLHIPT